MNKTSTKEYMRAYMKKWYQRMKADPERLAQYRASMNRWYQKHKQRMIDDPEYRKHIQYKYEQAAKRYRAKLKANPERLAEHNKKAYERTKRWWKGLSESERKALTKKRYRAHMNSVKSDPERFEKWKQRMAQATKKSYEKRKARLHQQGLTVKGTPFVQYKPKPEPKPTVWEIKTGKTLQSWAEQLGVTREAVRQKLNRAQKFSDSEQVFEQMRSNGEWPETVRLKFESIAGVKK